MKNSIRLICISVFILAGAQTFAQRTFEAILNVTTINSIEQNPDGTYILSFDSSGDGIMKLDACGRPMWVNFPVLRTNDEIISSIVFDPYTGGYIAGGSSPDTTLAFLNEPFVLLLDQNGNKVSERILLPGDIGGNVTAVSPSPDSGYVAAVYLDNFGSSNTSSFVRLNLSLGDLWDQSGNGSDITPPSVNINSMNEYVFSSFGNTGATAPAIQQIDMNGLLLNTFVVPDTFQGGCLFFRNAVIDNSVDGNYIAGATLAPLSSGYEYPYIVKLDGVLNPVWQKIFDWGRDAIVVSVLSTPDSGSVCVMESADTVYMVKLNSSGDSLWTKTYYGLSKVKVNYMRHCIDGGFVLTGSTNDGSGTYGFVLKLDNMLQLLPPVCIEVSPSSVICPGESVTISVDPGYQYAWSSGETSSSIQTSLSGSYSVVVTDIGSGLSAQSDVVQISFHQVTPPSINLLGNFLVSTSGTSYQWFLNGDSIPGANGMDITPSVSGDYTVMVTDANGCVSLSAIFPFIIPGINEADVLPAFELRKINREIIEVAVLYPQKGNLSLMDLRGVKIHEIEVEAGEMRMIQIPSSGISSGIYSLVWTSEKYMKAQKIVLTQ